jgi:hypothetical protein
MTEEAQHSRPPSLARQTADDEPHANRRLLLRLPFLATAASLTPFATAATLVPRPAAAATQPPNTYTEPLGASLEGWPYPGPLQFLPLTMEGQQVRMAYMDFEPTAPSNGRSIMLLHGKNFDSSYWAGPNGWLRQSGFRVVVPDQLGWLCQSNGRSSARRNTPPQTTFKRREIATRPIRQSVSACRLGG